MALYKYAQAQPLMTSNLFIKKTNQYPPTGLFNYNQIDNLIVILILWMQV